MENVNLIIDYAAKGVNAYKEANADGKIDLRDALLLIPLATDLPNIIAAAPKAYEEIKAATHQQRQELADKVVATIQIDKAEVEAWIAKVLDTVIGIVQVIADVPELRSVVSVSLLPPQE